MSLMYSVVTKLYEVENFRYALPEVMKIVGGLLRAGRCILFEMTPVSIGEQQVTFSRMLDILVTGEPKDHAIPRALQRKEITPEVFWDWYEDLAASCRSSSLEGVQVLESSQRVVEALKQQRLVGQVLIDLELDFSSVVFFPLISGDSLQGILFFSSLTIMEYGKDELYLAATTAKTITGLLAQQYRENAIILQQDFLRKTPDLPTPIEAPLHFGALSLEEQRLNELITSTIPDFIFLVDIEKGQLVFANTTTFLGYNILETDDPLNIFITHIHPDDQAEAIGGFLLRLKTAKDGEIIHSEYRMRHAEGHWLWVRERIKVFSRFPDGMVRQYLSVLQDFTSYKEALDKIERNKRRYRNFITYSTEGIYYVNCGEPVPLNVSIEEQQARFLNHAYFQECNQELARIYGLDSEEEIIGKGIEAFRGGPSFVSRGEFFKLFASNGFHIVDTDTRQDLSDGISLYFRNQVIGIIEGGYLIGIWGVQRDITAKRNAERALRESELKLSSIVHDARLGIWEWMPRDSNLKINKEGCELLGIAPFHTILSIAEFEQLIAPEDWQLLLQEMEFHTTHETDNFQLDMKVELASGRHKWVQLHGRMVEHENGSPVRLSGTMLDIHDLKMTELLLQEGEELLEAVVNAIPDIKIRVNVENGIILASYGQEQQAEHSLLNRVHVTGRKLDEVLPIFIAKGLLFNASNALLSKELTTFEFLDSGQGQIYHYEARINRINDQEVIIIIRDITQLKMVEKALNDQITKFDQKNRQLEKYIESNLQLENFAYVASHDLREPIRTMRTFAQFLQRRIGATLDTDSSQHLAFIIASANRMNQLIEDLLTFSKVNSEALTHEAIEIEDLLQAIIQNLQTTISENKAEIIVREMPDRIYGSLTRIQQLFQNLIANAIKFRQEGIPPKVIIESGETPTHWVFSVADNGIGIEEEFFDQIFVIFQKLHSPQAYAGTGIGLALVKRIITQHGGEISVQSQPGVGTTFRFTILK
ncbi:MAG: PAS domain S-box protein [Saprospiraceae bacterium]